MLILLWIYMYEHISHVIVLLIYMYSKKQAGKPCKRANVLYGPNSQFVSPVSIIFEFKIFYNFKRSDNFY